MKQRDRVVLPPTALDRSRRTSAFGE